MLGDSEAETVAVTLRGEVRPEDFLLHLGRNARTVVGDGYLHLAVRIERVERDDDVPVFLSFECLQRIADDIDEDLRNLLVVREAIYAGVRPHVPYRYLRIVLALQRDDMRQFLRQNFGPEAVGDGEAILRQLFDKQRDTDQQQPGAYRQTIADCCGQLRMVLPESQRLQLLAFLVSIAKADGNLHQTETEALRDITRLLGLLDADLNSMMGLGSTSLDDAYKVLEVSPDATDEEVKRAYKEQVKRNHPDRVAQLGEDVRRAAEEKMKQINSARDIIYQARGLN